MIIPVTLAQLTTPTTPEEALQDELTACIAQGLPTTAWQPVQMVSALLNINAAIASGFSQDVANIAQGAYASLAAQMVDSSGNPITSWMTLRATDQYGITPQAANFASGSVPYHNASGTSYPYSPNAPLHAQNAATGASYTSTGTGSVTPGNGTVAFQADIAGTDGTSAAGVILVLTTPLNGVSLTALSLSMVGSDAETNAALLARGQNKLATLAPIQSTDIPGPVAGGAQGAYKYVATSIPQASSSSAVPPYTVTATITGCSVLTSPSSGAVSVVIRNANGTPGAGDVAAVQAAVLALIAPDGFTVTTVAATAVSIPIIGTIYVAKGSAATAANIITNALDALALFFAAVPIGGVTTSQPNIVPLTDILSTIHGANAGTADVSLSSPSANVSLGSAGIPEVDASSAFAVVFV